MFFSKKNKKPDFENLYIQLKNKFNDEISEERKSELSDVMEQNGYYPSSFANCPLTNSEILFCLDKKQQEYKIKQNSNIKILNLGAFSNIMEWVKELILLPKDTIIYLLPFYKRDFECAYLIKDFEVNENIGTKEDIQLFVYLAHKSGHPVICDFITQFSRYAQPVIENPYLVRWIDVKDAEQKFSELFEKVSSALEKDFNKEDIEIVKNIYKQDSKGILNEEYKNIYKIFEQKVLEGKKELSKNIYKQENQIKLQKRVKGQPAEKLIEQGLWTVPCGADNEFGLPVFDYMNEQENYPVFKHFDKNENDVSESLKDDFQTPAYYINLNKNEINKDVLKYFIKLGKDLIEDYSFDGFKINNTKNIFENLSNDRLNKDFLKKFISEIKKNDFILISDGEFRDFAQYQETGFDMIWNDSKNLNPHEFLEKASNLGNYNTENLKINNLSAVKIYNDIFCELDNTNPSQLGEKGALFKWFCLNFLPTGKNSNMPILYMDGDESFTEQGFAKTIYENNKLDRYKNEDFYKNFDAIHKFASTSKIIKEGEATIICNDDDGFVCWLISKEPLKELFLIVANYKLPDEKVILHNDNEKFETYKENDAVVNKMITLPGECKISKEYIFDGEKYIEKDYNNDSDLLEIEVLNPCEYRIFLLRK